MSGSFLTPITINLLAASNELIHEIKHHVPPADPEADFLCSASHILPRNYQKTGEATPCSSPFHLLGGKELQHHSLCTQPCIPAQSGAAVPLTRAPTGIWGQGATAVFSSAEGMLCWEKGVYWQPGFPPQLPNTLLERNFVPPN